MGRLASKLAALVGAAVLSGACQQDAGTIPAPPGGVEDSLSGGFSQEGLQAIQEMMETAITDGRITAGIAAMAKDGKTVWLGAAGEMAP